MGDLEKKEYISLEKLIEILDDGARQLFNMSESEFAVSPLEARTLLPENVDRKVRFFENCDKEILFLKHRIADMQAAKKSLEGLKQKMENRLASAMVEHHFERLPGTKWNIECSSTEVIEVDDIEITEEIVLEYPQYVKITCELKPAELKKAILHEGKKFPFARLRPKHSIKTPERKVELK